ncbi:MAG: hypothetical protein JRN35_09050 [Nitrososphaerota archaeon]|nr:hypothetical protein [Nitrososphaerota archaeon]
MTKGPCRVPVGWLPDCNGRETPTSPAVSSNSPWQEVTTTSPSTLLGYGTDAADSLMVFDSTDNYVLLVIRDFSANNNPAATSTWTFTGSGWSQISIPTPPVFNYSTMVYTPDPASCFVGVSGCVTLLGGQSGAPSEYEWQYNATTGWANETANAFGPDAAYQPSPMPPLQEAAVVYDENLTTCPNTNKSTTPMKGCLVLVGGLPADVSCREPCQTYSSQWAATQTWEYIPGRSWVDVSSNPALGTEVYQDVPGDTLFQGPPELFFDPNIRQVILRVNVTMENPEISATDDHYLVLSPSSAGGKWEVTYGSCPTDVSNCVSGLYGTSDSLGSGVVDHNPIVFDAANDFAMTFGGLMNHSMNPAYLTDLNSTFAYYGDQTPSVGNAWLNVSAMAGLGTTANPSPSYRADALMVYDPKSSDCGVGAAHGCVILFGGSLGNGSLCPFFCDYTDTWRFWLAVTPEVYPDPDRVSSGHSLWLNITVIGGTGRYVSYTWTWSNSQIPLGCNTLTIGTRPNQAHCTASLNLASTNPWGNFFNVSATVTDSSGSTGTSGWSPVEVDPNPLVVHFYSKYGVMYPELFSLSYLFPGFPFDTGNTLGITVWANSTNYNGPGVMFPTSVQAMLVEEGTTLTVNGPIVNPGNNEIVYTVSLSQYQIIDLKLWDQIEFQVSFAGATIHTFLNLNATYGGHNLPYFPTGLTKQYGLIQPGFFIDDLWNLVLPPLAAAGQAQGTYIISSPGMFNDSYTVYIAFKLSFKSLGSDLPQPVAGGLSVLPPITLKFSLSSSGVVGLQGSYSFSNLIPSINIAGGKLQITPSAGIQAKWQIVSSVDPTGSETSSFVLTNISLSVGIEATLGMTIPIYGISLGPLGTVGISLILQLSLGVTLAFWMSQSVRGPLFLGIIPANITKLETTILLGIGAFLSVGIGPASVALGGQLVFTLYLQSVGPLLRGAQLAGQILVVLSFFWFSVSFALWSGVIWQTGNPTPGGIHWPHFSALGSNWGIGSRYYNTSSYEEDVWAPGAALGTLMEDVYPGGTYSLASSSNGSYLAYASDNVSRSRPQGLELGMLHVLPNGRTVSAADIPSTPGEVTTNPQLLTLPDGSVLALWDALPLTHTSVSTPVSLPGDLLQTATLDPVSGTWGPVSTVSGWGFPLSYHASSCGTDTQVAYLDLASPFVQSGNLVLYDLANGIVAANRSVAGASRIVSFDCPSHLAILQDFDGNYTVLNLSSGADWIVPSVSGYNVTEVSGVEGAPGDVVVTYRNASQAVLDIVDSRTGSILATLNPGINVSGTRVISSGGGFVVSIRSPFGVSIYLVTSQGSSLIKFLPWNRVISDRLSISDGSLVVVGENQWGSSSQPLRNLSMAIIPLVGITPITSSTDRLDAGQRITLTVAPIYAIGPVHYTWTGLPPGCVSLDQPMLTCTPSASGNYTISTTLLDGRGFTATTPAYSLSVAPPLNISSAQLLTTSTDVGSPLAGSGTVSGGTPGYNFSWVGLPPGCIAGNASTFSCTPSLPGNFTIHLVVRDASGSSVSVLVGSVTVVAPVVVVGILAAETNTVPGSTDTFRAIIRGGTGPYSYYWTVPQGGCPASIASSFSCHFSSAGSYNVTVIVQDSRGSISSGTFQLTVTNPAASPSAWFLYVLLVGASVVLVASVVVWWWPKRQKKA